MTPDKIKSSLASLSAAAEKTRRAGDAIGTGASDRHAAVMKRMAELSPLTLSDPEAAKEYSALVAERGQLEIVLGQHRS